MKIVVLGLGFMGATHLKALRNIPQAELVAVASDDERARCPGVRMYYDWSEAVLDPEAEAVDICLPTHLHAPATVAALLAGKHVLVEKPMALTSAGAARMIEAARDSGRILMAAQVLRFFPAYRALADVLQSGRLGRVRAAMFRRRSPTPAWSAWLTDKGSSGGGIFDLMLHDIDMSLHLFGQPQAVSATGYEDLPAGLDCITAQLHYPGMTVALAGGWYPISSYPFSMEYSVVGESGAVEYSSAAPVPVLYAGDSRTELALSEVDGYQAELEYFVECCLEEKQPELCPPEESARAVRLALLMLESREKGGEILPWKSE